MAARREAAGCWMVVIYGLGNMPGNRRAVPSASGIDVSRPLHVRRDLRGSQLLAGKPPTTTKDALPEHEVY
jgi:hypothetical protein